MCQVFDHFFDHCMTHKKTQDNVLQSPKDAKDGDLKNYAVSFGLVQKWFYTQINGNAQHESRKVILIGIKP